MDYPITGNVSLGNVSGNIKLYVNDSGSGNLTGFGYNNNCMTFSVNQSVTANPEMVIDQFGNVGIGTQTPAYTLDVSGIFRSSDVRIDNTIIHLGQNSGLTSQGGNTVAIGFNAGSTTQRIGGVAIGDYAGQTNQRVNSVAIGTNSGTLNQSGNSVAIGFGAGSNSQGINATALGYNAGNLGQGTQTVAVGHNAGQITQGDNATALGYNAGNNNQGLSAIAIGDNAGQGLTTGQGSNAIAIGVNSARTSQSTNAVSIGNQSADITQGADGISIGRQAGRYNQGAEAISIGVFAGLGQSGTPANQQATKAIAIGKAAGGGGQGTNSISIGGYSITPLNAQSANSIQINATNTVISQTTASSCVIAPIRTTTIDYANNATLFYNTSTSEVFKVPSASFSTLTSTAGTAIASGFNSNIRSITDIPAGLWLFSWSVSSDTFGATAYGIMVQFTISPAVPTTLDVTTAGTNYGAVCNRETFNANTSVPLSHYQTFLYESNGATGLNAYICAFFSGLGATPPLTDFTLSAIRIR
jgi:hypothetical protein